MTYGAGFAGMLVSMVMTANEAAFAGDRDQFRDRVPAPMGEIGDDSVQLVQASGRIDFAIPAQPLESAAAEFTRQSGLPIVLDPGLTAGRQSGAVSGSFTAQEAMERLLAGTGLSWRFAGDGSIAVSTPQTQADGGAYTLPPLVVTGEKTDRSLKDTSTSVAVLDSEAIEQRPALRSTNDILERIPNLTTTGTNNLAPAVRGVDGTGPAQGADAFFAGTRPRLNMQIDGRPASYNEVVFGNFSTWDVDQVEILRGAQSQLQGRNAIAGTVVVNTKDPTYDWEVGARVLGGTYETVQGSAVVSGPIMDDQLAFRLSFDRAHSDSFVHMLEFFDVDDPEDYVTTSVRGKLLIEPNSVEGFSTLLTLSYYDSIAPQWEGIRRPFDEHQSAFPFSPVFRPKTASAVAETTWELSDHVAFENTLSIADLSVRRYARPGDGNAEIDGLEVMEEPLLRFSGLDDRLNGIAGIYYFNANQDESIDLFGGGRFKDHTRTAAVFAEMTYAVLDDLDITAGGRFEWEHRDRSGGVGPFTIDLDETYTAFLPKVGIAWHATEELTLGAVVSRGYNGGGAGFTFAPPFSSYRFDPEYVWTYEAYARADLDEGRLSLTGNLFFSDYKDMQLPFDLNPDPAVWSVVIRNADRAITYGAEIGARWRPLQELELFGEIGLLKTDVTDFPGSGVQGNELALSPTFTVEVGGIYRHESGVDFSADARISDGYYSSINNDPRGEIDPFVVVNAQLGYSFIDHYPDARFFVFATNLFDADEPIQIEPGAIASGDAAILQHPRTVGVGLEMKF